MNTFVIYTTKTASYIVPKDQFSAKRFSHSYEVDTPLELCTKKAKLPVRITEASKVGEVLKVLCVEVPHDEDDKQAAGEEATN